MHSPVSVEFPFHDFLSQIPLYPVTIFENEYDGDGMSYVLYFKLSEGYSKELPLQFQENIMVRYMCDFDFSLYTYYEFTFSSFNDTFT